MVPLGAPRLLVAVRSRRPTFASVRIILFGHLDHMFAVGISHALRNVLALVSCRTNRLLRSSHGLRFSVFASQLFAFLLGRSGS